ncbi:uracil phosphoribosyltransferase [Candidatus Dependentiae bacterium]|jgi:uracil phosphoribosyltransferase|nr:uracil phosphoribosyltransferase [Candidatus Dependentiae bacterium]
MQRLRPLLYYFFIAGTLFTGSAGAMLDEYAEPSVPAIVKNYKPLSPLELMLLTTLRDQNTDMALFSGTVRNLTPFLVQRVFQCLEMQDVIIQTPVAQSIGAELKNNIVLVTVLRSGDALLEGFRRYLPDAPVGKILVQRDEQTSEPNYLYRKVPKAFKNNKKIVILEPMIATGGSLSMVIEILLHNGVAQENIIVSSVVAAPEGLHKLAEKFPEISVTVLSIDEKLNEKMFIVPGLGDFGDRFYGTDDYDADSEDD